MEKWLMLEGNLEHQDRLIGERIAFIQLAITKPRTATGLAFPEGELPKIREALSLSSEFFSEVVTNLEGVFLMEGKTFQVTRKGGDLEQWESIEPILREYAQSMRIDIVVSNPHGKTCEAKTEEGKLFVCFWSTPVGAKKTKCPVAFSQAIHDGQDDAFELSGKGTPILDDEGIVVAEVVGGTLYVLFDLPHHGTPAGPIMRSIMERWALFTIPSEERDRFFAEAEKREAERSRQAYIAECGKRLKIQADAAKEKLDEAIENQAEFSQKLTEAIRSEMEARRKLEQLAEAKKSVEPRFGEEFDRLLHVPGVVRVTVDSTAGRSSPFGNSSSKGVISVYTEHLFTQTLKDGTVRDLGQFRIDIRTDGSGVKIYNLTREVDSHPHPHHRRSNEPCLGNIQEGITKLVAGYEFSVVAQIMLQFLQMINEDDEYGRRAYHWPIAGSAEAATPVAKPRHSVFGRPVDDDEDDFDDDQDDRRDEEEDSDEYVSQ